jgi:hypothetical protein
MPTTTNFGWTTPADTDLVKDGAAAIRTLGSNIDTSLVDLKGGTTGQYLQKNSGTDLDYVWATVSAGGITLISETVASAISSLSLSSIPSDYKSLLLVFSGIRHSATGSAFGVRLNNNSGAVYSGNYTTTKGATVQAAASGTETQLQTGNAAYLFGENNAQTAHIGYMTNGYLMIDNYASTTKSKTYYGQNGYWNNTDSDRGIISTFQGNFHSTSAVSSIDIFRTGGSATFSNETTIAETSIRLYGLS